jgi:hypothetical protein
MSHHFTHPPAIHLMLPSLLSNFKILKNPEKKKKKLNQTKPNFTKLFFLKKFTKHTILLLLSSNLLS